MINDDDLWILSFYRTSEITGALFFGRLARSMRPGPTQRDMTKHFSDESLHAWYWTECIERLGGQPLKLDTSYQDQYLAEAGMPVNMMEILAITQVFERRVINQYARHERIPGVHPQVQETITKIMEDEKWHLEWIRDALRAMEPDYGKENIESTLRRFTEADLRVYEQTMNEHADIVQHLLR